MKKVLPSLLIIGMSVMLLYVATRLLNYRIVLVHSEPPTAPQASELEVYPPEAKRLPVSDIADLVASLIPTGGFDSFGWDYLEADPQISWQTAGVDDSDVREAVRRGLARVRVAGKTSTLLLKRKQELAWTITLATNESAKFEPRKIEIDPGVFPEKQCFGTNYEGCIFTAEQALASPSLSKRLICRTSEFGNETAAYAVSRSGGKPVLAVYSRGAGSGGESASLELRAMGKQTEACK